MSALSSLTALANAESSLIATLDAATARAGEIATGALDHSFGRFRQALGGAHTRLSSYYTAISQLAGAALADLNDFANQLLESIPPSLPVPEVQELPPVVSLEELLAAESEADEASAPPAPATVPELPSPHEADSEGGETDQADADVVDLAATAPDVLAPGEIRRVTYVPPDDAASPEVLAPASAAKGKKGGRKKVVR